MSSFLSDTVCLLFSDMLPSSLTDFFSIGCCLCPAAGSMDWLRDQWITFTFSHLCAWPSSENRHLCYKFSFNSFFKNPWQFILISYGARGESFPFLRKLYNGRVLLTSVFFWKSRNFRDRGNMKNDLQYYYPSKRTAKAWEDWVI